MKYIRVKWIHSLPNEPITLFSELDDDRYEVRKLEIFAMAPVGERQGTRVLVKLCLGNCRFRTSMRSTPTPSSKQKRSRNLSSMLHGLLMRDSTAV
jgi:hypothetical protein